LLGNSHKLLWPLSLELEASRSTCLKTIKCNQLLFQDQCLFCVTKNKTKKRKNPSCHKKVLFHEQGLSDACRKTLTVGSPHGLIKNPAPYSKNWQWKIVMGKYMCTFWICKFVMACALCLRSYVALRALALCCNQTTLTGCNFKTWECKAMILLGHNVRKSHPHKAFFLGLYDRIPPYPPPLVTVLPQPRFTTGDRIYFNKHLC